jgi:chromosome segregation ATPase
MYKRGGEIKRIFSKQKFDLNKVLRNDEIVPLKEVIDYANAAEYKYRPQTNEEYKRIIYGMDNKRLDFKLTTIRNYNTFINLYNKIFNVNRAVFDAKSIKEVIFTTLDRVEAGEINYEDFANELLEYRHYFIFYRKFNEQKANIEKLYIYKNALLNLKDDINEILEKIAYKKEVEEEEILKLQELLKELEYKKRKVLKQFGYFDKKIKNIEKNIESNIFEIESKINEIKKLKEIFSINKIQEAERKIALKDELNKKLITLQTSLNELIKGIKNQVEEIEEEIDRLKREKRILKEKFKEEEIRAKRELEEIFYEKIEKLKEEYLKKEQSIYQEIKNVENDIEKILETKEKYNKELNEINEKFLKKEEEIKKEIFNAIEEFKEKKRTLEIQKNELLNEIVKLKKELNRIKIDYEDDMINLKKHYKKEINLIDEKIKFFENILKTKPNSFKEFLNQNVDNWEEELYPVIDEKLLSMDIDDLKPKIVSERVFGIELDKSKLKSIPTMREAEEEIERLNTLKKSLNEELNQKLGLLEKDFKTKEIEILSKIDVNNEKINEINEEFKKIEEKIKNLKEKLKDRLNELETLKNEEIKLVKLNIKKQDEIVNSLKEKIESLRREIKKLKKELNSKIEELNKLKEQELRDIINNLKEKIKKEEALIDEKINELNIKKNKISKDERIEELNREIAKITEKLKEIEKYELYLKEYEDKKVFIQKEGFYKKELEKFKNYKERINEFFVKMENKLNEKLANIEKNIKDIEDKIEIINKGLKEVSNIKLPEKKLKTNEYLLYLIEEYRKKDGEFKEKRISFKDTASNIKTALERFAIEGLEVNFNIEKLADLVDEELEKVDELYIFKDKKFEILNKTRIKGLKNLISGILDKKLDNFENAKEDFLSQVRRINHNLSKVDFGIIKNIKIEIEESKRNILKIFDEIKKNIEDLIILLDNEESLFFDRADSDRKLKKIEELFNMIKKEVKNESFSLIDVVDINVKFTENEKENTLKLIKNESSTGGSILLKIAIAVSLLELFIKEKANLFLILDEVSVLSTKNQKLLKEYVNERGLGVIYVTPDLPLVDVEDIDIYKFRNVGGEFEVVKLIADEGIKVDINE